MGLGDALVEEIHCLLHDGEDISDILSYCSGNNLVRRRIDVSLYMAGLSG
jgi:hypothetical protein